MGLRFLKWRFLGENLEDFGREEELLEFSRLNGVFPSKTEEEEPHVEQGRRGGGRGLGRSSGRGQGRPPSRGSGRGRSPKPPADPDEDP